jgi:hypothetical protein
MLESAADEAGIKHPADTDADFDKEEYPHWYVLCATQLGRPMIHGEHFENAKNLAKIPVEELKTLDWNQLADRGVCPHV